MNKKFTICNLQFTKKAGQLLVEVIISVGLIAILVAAVIPLVLSSANASSSQSKGMVAAYLAKEQIEAATALAKENWNDIYFPLGTSNKGASNPYNLIIDTSKWQLSAGEQTINLDNVNYTCSIVIDDVKRSGTNGSGDITGDNTGWDDPSTQKITATVSDFGGTPFQIVQYISRWQSQNWVQADWSGGDGITNFQDPPGNQYFSGTNIDATTVAGSLMLAKSGAGGTGSYGNKFLLESTGTIGRLNNSSKRASLRFTAQKTGTINQISLYLANLNNSSNLYYRYGIQADNSGSPSGTFLSYADQNFSGVTGWKTITISDLNITAGTVYHLVVQYDHGTQSPAGNRYIDIRNSQPQNLLVPVNQVGDLNQETLFYSGSWSAQTAQPIYILTYDDNTYEGNSFDTSEVRSIYAFSFEGEKFTPSADTEISGLRLYLSKNTNQDPADNLYVSLKDLTSPATLVDNAVFTDGASLTTSFTWITYNLPANVTLTAAHEYRLYISSPGSNVHRYYRIYAESNPNAASYNSINWDGTNSVVSRSANSGGSWTETNFVDWAGYDFITVLTQSYETSGDLISGGFDFGKKVGINRIYWENTDLPANATVKIQLASNNDNTTWNFIGPDGTAATFYTIALGENIFSGLSNNQYLRYKVYLETADSNVTPSLGQVLINYSP